MKEKNRPIILILYNIRSSYNVGSIFRTADAVGVEKIYLVGYTPAPVDKFGRLNKQINKTALGAEKNIIWEKVSNIPNLVKKIPDHQLIALEQNNNSIDYRKLKIKSPTGIILGEEVKGIPEKILSLCDQIVEIPMSGKKESLNVSVATGVLLFHLRDF